MNTQITNEPLHAVRPPDGSTVSSPPVGLSVILSNLQFKVGLIFVPETTTLKRGYFSTSFSA